VTLRTWLTPLQAGMLALAKEVLDSRVAEAEAAFARAQRLVIADMDVPGDVTGTFQRDGDRVVFVETDTGGTGHE